MDADLSGPREASGNQSTTAKLHLCCGEPDLTLNRAHVSQVPERYIRIPRSMLACVFFLSDLRGLGWGPRAQTKLAEAIMLI